MATLEIWELIESETEWSNRMLAEDHTGEEVSPWDIKAVRYSLIGGLLKCYVPRDENWTPMFEARRSLLMTSIIQTPYLYHVVVTELKCNTLRKLSLHELNQSVPYRFIQILLTTARKLKGEA